MQSQNLTINTPSQVLNAEKVTHMDCASCQLLYAYSQYLFVFNSALIVATPSDKFIKVSCVSGATILGNGSVALIRGITDIVKQITQDKCHRQDKDGNVAA
jgi:hypothetical protein